jgi:hypothetical protein
MRRTITTLLLGAALIAVAVATPAQARTAAHLRRLALVDAGDLVGGVTMPAGSDRVPTAPSGAGFTTVAVIYADEVDRHGFWITTASPAQALKAVTAGMAPRQAPPTDVVDNSAEASATFTLPAAGSGIGQLVVGLDALRLHSRTTAVRVDALVRYLPPRLPGQRVPAAAHALTVTRRFGGRAATVDRTVTGAAVARIAQLVDGLPIAAPVTEPTPIVCPFIPAAAVDSFVFRARPGGPVLARVTASAATPTAPDPCTTIPLKVGAHAPVRLLDGGRLLRGAGSILGVSLVGGPGPPVVGPPT